MTDERENVMEGGRWLKGLREARGETLRDVERATDVTQQNISNIEGGRVEKPAMGTLMTLARHYGVSPQEVAYRYGWWGKPIEDPLVARLAITLDKLDAPGRNRLRHQVEGILDVTDAQ